MRAWLTEYAPRSSCAVPIYIVPLFVPASIEWGCSRRPNPLAGLKALVSRGEQHVTEAAVLPTEIEQLPDLAGYLKFTSHPAWLRVRLPRQARREPATHPQHEVNARDQVENSVDFHWLDQVVVEARGTRPLFIRGLPPRPVIASRRMRSRLGSLEAWL